MIPTWGEFMTKLRALYAEYPGAAKAYESDYDDLAARLAEAERLLRAGVDSAEDFIGSDRGFPLEEWATKARHYFDLRATDSAELAKVAQAVGFGNGESAGSTVTGAP